MILFALVSACTGDSAVAPAERVARVEVTPEEAFLTSVGATMQFVATAKDEGGRPITDAVVIWRSSGLGVAVVDPSTGLVTAVAEGSAIVTAEAGGVTGEATVEVDVLDCVQPLPVSLAVGEVLVTEPPASADCAFLLPSGSLGDRYRVAIVRLAAEAKETTVSATLTLLGRGGDGHVARWVAICVSTGARRTVVVRGGRDGAPRTGGRDCAGDRGGPRAGPCRRGVAAPAHRAPPDRTRATVDGARRTCVCRSLRGRASHPDLHRSGSERDPVRHRAGDGNRAVGGRERRRGGLPGQRPGRGESRIRCARATRARFLHGAREAHDPVRVRRGAGRERGRSGGRAHHTAGGQPGRRLRLGWRSALEDRLVQLRRVERDGAGVLQRRHSTQHRQPELPGARDARPRGQAHRFVQPATGRRHLHASPLPGSRRAPQRSPGKSHRGGRGRPWADPRRTRWSPRPRSGASWFRRASGSRCT